MGRVIEGESLSWDASKEAAPTARLRGIEQLLHMWHRQKDRKDPEPLWGDEIEYTLIELDEKNARATVLLEQEEVLQRWKHDRRKDAQQIDLQPEWANYVVEGVPAKPHGCAIADLLCVEQDMRQRRQLISRYLEPNQAAMTLCVFPRIGTKETFSTPDCAISSRRMGCSAPRYQIVRRNLMLRKGRRAESHIPIFQDDNTCQPFREPQVICDPSSNHPAHLKDDFLHLDGMDMGMGSCSLQITIQAPDEPNARWLHDQLIPLGPVMLALTASAPVWKGRLVDLDSRWSRYSDCADDRSHEEMDTTTPRWDSNQSYISQDVPDELDNSHNLGPFNPEFKRRLMEGGMDAPLATHFAAIFTRDPLMLTRDDVDNYSVSNDNLLEQFQGAVWPTVRFKPPFEDDGPGWRVEFRPMETQLCDFDNAAFAIFMYLLSRAIMSDQINMYVPVDKVNESMVSAQKRNATMEERLWFRRKGWQQAAENGAGPPSCSLLTLDEIINGEDQSNPSRFPGLLDIVRSFVQRHYDMTATQDVALNAYLDRIAERASGKNPTPAQWMRKYIAEHDDYEKDGYVSEKVCFDTIKEILSFGDNQQK